MHEDGSPYAPYATSVRFQVWQFGLRVPADLIQLCGKESVRQSLGTTDMAIHSGARLHEFARSTVADIETRNGVPTFTIGKSKTAAGERTVPIHSELVRLGFLDYVEDRRVAGHATLWRLNDQPNRDGSTFFSDWHRIYRKVMRYEAVFFCVE